MPDDLDAIVKQYGGSVSSAPATSAPSDVDAIVKQYGGTIQSGPQQPKPSASKALPAWEQALSTVQIPGVISPGSIPAAIEAGKGFLKGAARDAVNIATLGGRVKPVFGDPSTLPPEAKVNLAPSNPAQQVGASAEEAAAFALPAAGPAKVTRAVEALPTAARLLGKAVVEGVGAGLVAGAHTGDPAAMGKAALAAGGTSAVLGAAGEAIPKLASAVRSRIPNVNNPTVENAIKSVQSDVPMTVGQRTGNTAIQRLEQGLENVPGSSSKVQQFFNQQQEALAQKGSNLAGQVSPVGTNAYGAGEALQQRLQQRIARLKGQANNLYDSIRTDTAANQKVVQTGVRQSSVVDQFGNPIQSPIMQTLETPVDLQPIRQQLQPIYDDLVRSMPEARRTSSPAFRALQDLMTSKDPYMNAMDFDRSLGAIKALARDGQSPYLTSQSQRIAKQVVSNGEQQLQSALQTAGSNVPQKLDTARRLVRSYYETSDLLQDLNSEPAALYSNLTTGGDRVLNTLYDLNKIAPNEVRTIGRTFLENLMDKATKEGGFSRAPGIMADWNRLGPKTKQLLFGARADDIDNFMIAAKTLTKNQNPSGTTKMAAALGSYGAAGSALWALLTGHPLAATGVGAGMAASRLAADFLLSDGAGPALSTLSQAIKTARAVGPPLAGFGAMPPPQRHNQPIMPPPGQ